MQANYSNSPYTFALFLLGILLPQVLQYDSLEQGFPVSQAEPEIASSEVGPLKFVQQDFVSEKDRLANCLQMFAHMKLQNNWVQNF